MRCRKSTPDPIEEAGKVNRNRQYNNAKSRLKVPAYDGETTSRMSTPASRRRDGDDVQVTTSV